jgi:hypothetical protein
MIAPFSGRLPDTSFAGRLVSCKLVASGRTQCRQCWCAGNASLGESQLGLVNYRAVARAAVIACLLSAVGCETEPPPMNATGRDTPIAVDFTSEALSPWNDMPMGTYRVPNSKTLVSGFEKGSPLAIALGVVGGSAGTALTSAAYGQAMDRSGGNSAVKPYEGALQITLEPVAIEHLRTMLENDRFTGKFTLKSSQTGTTLSVSGNVVLEFFENGDVRPFVVLRAKLMSAQQRVTWTMRYFASIGGSHPLSGDNSWTANSGELLKKTVSLELQRALLVLLNDVGSPLPRDANAKVAAEGYFPFIKKRVQVVGFRVAEDADWFAFQAKVPSTSLLAGVNVMDRSSAQYRPATPGDPLIRSIGGS